MPNFLNNYRNAPARVEKRVLDLATAKPRLIQEIASYIRDPLSRFALDNLIQVVLMQLNKDWLKQRKLIRLLLHVKNFL